MLRVVLLLPILVIALILAACSQPAVVGQQLDLPSNPPAATPEGGAAEQTNPATDQPTPALPAADNRDTASSSSGQTATSAGQSTYNGVSVGFTEEGFPYWGDPNAPVVVEEYSDNLCPFCGRHFQQSLPGFFEQFGKSGQGKNVLRGFSIPSLHPTIARRAAQ